MAPHDGRPERAGRKRRQILDAARALFVSAGFAATSMDGVVARAGVSKQTLYRYFPSKTDLLVSVLTDELGFADATQAAPVPLQTQGDVRRALLRLARGITDRLMRPDEIEVLRLILGEAMRIPEARDILRTSLPEQLLGRTENLLRAAAAKGLVVVPRPDLSARMFIGPVFSFVALDGLLSPTPPDPPTNADLEALVDIFLRTVRAER